MPWSSAVRRRLDGQLCSLDLELTLADQLEVRSWLEGRRLQLLLKCERGRPDAEDEGRLDVLADVRGAAAPALVVAPRMASPVAVEVEPVATFAGEDRASERLDAVWRLHVAVEAVLDCLPHVERHDRLPLRVECFAVVSHSADVGGVREDVLTDVLTMPLPNRLRREEGGDALDRRLAARVLVEDFEGERQVVVRHEDALALPSGDGEAEGGGAVRPVALPTDLGVQRLRPMR